MIGIIDYGLGNIRSVLGAVEKLGFNAKVSSDKTILEGCTKLILPGVGAFGDGMKNLTGLGLDTFLSRLVLDQKVPILGICLGAQLFSSEGFEFGHHQGLGWIKASVKKIELTDEAIRLPHVGWNDLKKSKDSRLLNGIPEEALFYFTHSYYIAAEDSEDVVATTTYGATFPSIVEHNNIYAVQFHPEKSQLHGLALLKNFLELS